MKLFNGNIKTWPSMKYEKWYSVKRHLVDRFPNMVTYVIPTTLKGIGKSYSIWKEILIPAMNNGEIVLFIRWSKGELQAAIDSLQKTPKVFADRINVEIEWTKLKELTVVRNKETQEVLAYFVTPSQFKIIKGLASLEETDIKDGKVFWEEFLIPDGIYRKPKETIDSFIQVLGSLFRTKKFVNFMAANNVNPQNPFMDYLFTELGWPEMGQTIVDYDSKTVIDSPWFNKFIEAKYENSALASFAKLNPAIYKQLFGQGSLNDSVYNNQEMIIYRLDKDVNFKFKFQIGIVKFTVYTYQDNGIWLCYITDQKTPSPAYFAGDMLTSLETGLELIGGDLIKSLKAYVEDNRVRYKSIKVMNVIQDWLIRYKDFNKPIDWSKEKMKINK